MTEIFGGDQAGECVQELALRSAMKDLSHTQTICKDEDQQFKLANPGQMGQRISLHYLLVDPEIGTISTANVPLQ